MSNSESTVMSWLDHASDTVVVAEDKGEAQALLSSKSKSKQGPVKGSVSPETDSSLLL